MLTKEMRASIRDFVRAESAMPEGTDEAPDRYFRALVGAKINRATGPLRGVYIRQQPDVERLILLVVQHVEQVWTSEDEPRRVFLTAFEVGDKSPYTFLPLDFENGRSSSEDAADRIRAAGGVTAMDSGASIAMLTTLEMMQGFCIQAMTQNRELMEIAVEARVGQAHAQLETRVAQAHLEIVEQGDGVKRIDKVFDRLDPHLAKWFPPLLASLAALAAKRGAAAPKPNATPPDDPSAAADWHIDQFEATLTALGTFFMGQPHELTKPREERIGELIQRMLAAAQALQEEG